MAERESERRYARVEEKFAGYRLDRFLVEHYPQYSRKKVAEVIRSGSVRIDGVRARPGTVLRGGERLQIPVMSRAVADVSHRTRKRERLRQDSHAPNEVEVLHRDDDLLVVAKPPGVPVHGGAGLGAVKTLVDLLKDDVLAGFGLVHRIDRDTSGAVAFVRGETFRAETTARFAESDGGVQKVYEALVEGVVEPARGDIRLPLTAPGHGGRAEVSEKRGRAAHTRYETVEAFGEASRLRLELQTGRTHQIRAHLAAIKHPLLVDTRYGNRGGWHLRDPRGQLDARLRRTPLHAAELTLPHPRTGELVTVKAPLPADIKYALVVLRVRAGRRRSEEDGADA